MVEFNLKKVLEQKNMSMYRLQKVTEISPSVIWKYNRGDIQRVDLSVLDKFCKALSCNVSDLMEFKDDNK